MGSTSVSVVRVACRYSMPRQRTCGLYTKSSFCLQKQEGTLKEWSWVWVFWPYWMLASICLAIAAWASCKMIRTSDSSTIQQSSKLRIYNLGFFLILTLPLTGACYLDGLLSDEAAYIPPVCQSLTFEALLFLVLHSSCERQSYHL